MANRIKFNLSFDLILTHCYNRTVSKTVLFFEMCPRLDKMSKKKRPQKDKKKKKKEKKKKEERGNKEYG